mgnify:CR=1 FL=1
MKNPRKQYPIYSGFVKYFPDAMKEVSNLSFVANEQHNPGTEMHWDKSKSTDELDALMRHLADHSNGIEFDDDGIRHLTKVAWRAMAMLQRELEKAGYLSHDEMWKQFADAEAKECDLCEAPYTTHCLTTDDKWCEKHYKKQDRKSL